ncbi:MAG TPA: NAD-glutamate dehydrogenase [Woeseiaceae bacterium]|nr:NAD-glutamate dehydrogenase [Woeseiaceae bacterium]
MKSHKLRRDTDAKQRIVDAIVASPVDTRVLKSRDQVARYLRQYFRDVPVEDLQGRSERIMAQIAIDHLEIAATRKDGKPSLRIYNPTEKQHGYTSNFTIIEMVNDDMPFLVDSVGAAIARQELGIHITVHPVIRIRRDARGRLLGVEERDSDKGRFESFVRYAVDRETDPQQLRVLEHAILKVLADVRIAVRDWGEMRDRMLAARDSLDVAPAGVDQATRRESKALLDWMIDERFTFLGYREYRLKSEGDRMFLHSVQGSGLGLLSRDERGGNAIELTPEMRRLTRSGDLLIITKANSRSTVHRQAYLDYVGVKIFDSDGTNTGEHRFIGLFTSAAYSESPRHIPLLRYKVQRVLDRSHVEPKGHRGKALLHILDTFPRDELFQSSVADLARTTFGILNLQERQRVRLFVRRDTFRRFYSCLVYVPREKYTTAVRQSIEAILKEAFDGIAVDSSVEIFDSPLARVHIIIRTTPAERPRISLKDIEARIVEVVITWTDRLRDELTARFGQDEGHRLFRSYGQIFPAGFQEETLPAEACSDIERIARMRADGELQTVNLYRPAGLEPGHMHFIIYSDEKPLSLSEVLPVLENMGVDVYTERPYELAIAEDDAFWIQDFHLRNETDADIDVSAAARRFEECFLRVVRGDLENDGLNRLVLAADLDWRQVALLRTYTKYLQQLAMPFSQHYMEDVLVAHAGFVRLLVRQFELQFDPALKPPQRKSQLEAQLAAVGRAVGRARNVDEDRILSAFAGAVAATLRSNYFLAGADGNPRRWISIKLNPRELREAPRPRPAYEIFVYSPEVEGVHLRAGDVARGGLRWSDRREDFRTEVLGLMKAQVVKNTVIVPTGAKGGFFCKRLASGDRDARLAGGIECYKTFIRGLLDITDNVVDGSVVAAPGVVRRDGDDPYLVVAADKGTATFSDIANGIAAEYGFWLGDAFASGGSAGYDHKKMAITARGAWEAVRRHFREQGLNTQRDPFTVIGIGDMSGDVFGNGMLLSRKIRLRAAFNHLHIFLDPDPDMAASFRERKRLFRKPRSGWDDYDDKVISRGGGVFSRQAKTIRLSAEARAMLGTEETAMQPDELIRHILRMEVDLLWNGGIGTYVKASTEGHSDVGDRSNDNVRVNANALRCKVIAEGGNLGLTQLARIEYSLNGGRINTDFIDNSGGVDSSDREVNIKILLSDAEKYKGLTRPKRNQLLASMTDDVAELVLRNNYLQTQAISMSEIRSVERIDETARLIANLERTGLLDRTIEYLPEDADIEERRARKQGFTRPELAVILSYAKIDLYNGLIASTDSFEDFLAADPPRYFPAVLRRRYGDLLPTHRLSRQILATMIANNIVNRMGPSFVQRMLVDTNADIVTIARAYTVARQIIRAGNLLETIESLDYKVPATAQMSMMFEVSRTLRHVCYWLIDRFGNDLEIAPAVERLQERMTSIYTRTGSIISTAARERHRNSADAYVAMGVPEKIADRMSSLLLTRAALDIADLAALYRQDVLASARVYSMFNEHLGVYWLHSSVEDLKVDGRWQAIARSNLREEFFRIRRDLAAKLMAQRSKRDVAVRVSEWLARHAEDVARFRRMIEEMKLRGDIDFATLTVAAQELRDLSSS